jgi:hypothetical protein
MKVHELPEDGQTRSKHVGMSQIQVWLLSYMNECSDALILTAQICTRLKMFQCRMSQASQIFTQRTEYSLPGIKAATQPVSVFTEVLSKDVAPFLILSFVAWRLGAGKSSLLPQWHCSHGQWGFIVNSIWSHLKANLDIERNCLKGYGLSR